MITAPLIRTGKKISTKEKAVKVQRKTVKDLWKAWRSNDQNHHKSSQENLKERSNYSRLLHRTEIALRKAPAWVCLRVMK